MSELPEFKITAAAMAAEIRDAMPDMPVYEASDLIYSCEPTAPAAMPDAAGVTKGYVVITSGGEAQVADAALLLDGNGWATLEVLGEFKTRRIVDDTGGES